MAPICEKYRKLIIGETILIIKLWFAMVKNGHGIAKMKKTL